MQHDPNRLNQFIGILIFFVYPVNISLGMYISKINVKYKIVLYENIHKIFKYRY